MTDRATFGYAAAAMIAVVTVIRLAVVGLSPLQLHGDEAQYFAWSRELAAGYFSKPPAIAWVIRASTEVFGTGEFGVRMWSPLAHGGAAGFLYLSGRRLFDAKTGFWAALVYITLPGVVLSSGIASTDALLLLFVSVFLWAWAEIRQGPLHLGPRAQGLSRFGWVYVLAIAMGLGLMSKYAMAFVLAGLVANLLVDRPTRARAHPRVVFTVVLIVGAIVAANVNWNLENDFATASHTVANANLHAELLNPLEGLEFAASQFGVAGPVVFGLLLWAMVRGWRDPDVRPLVVFTAAPLLIVLAQAFLSRANANWAASALAPGALLVSAVWARSGLMNGLRAGVGVNALVAVVVTLATVSLGFADAVGLSNSVKRVRGWDATVVALGNVADANGAKAIAVDNRITFYALDYYGLGEVAPLYAWKLTREPHNQAELTRALPRSVEGPILFVNYHDEHLDSIREDFASVRALPPLSVPLGPHRVRTLDLYAVDGFVPVPRVRVGEAIRRAAD